MGQINECKIAVFQAGGATSYAFNDAGYEFLVAKGVTPGHINDMWMTYLASEGYTGALSDMMWAYWVDQACLGNEAATEYFLTLTGTQYGELAEPVTFTSDFEIEVEFSTTTSGVYSTLFEAATDKTFLVRHDTDDKIRVYAGNGAAWDAERMTFDAPNDGSRHVLKITNNSGSWASYIDDIEQATSTQSLVSRDIKYIGTRQILANNFQGIIHSVKLSGTGVDTQTWTLNSGSIIYEEAEEFPREADIMREDDWATPNPGITVADRTASFSGTQGSYSGVNANDNDTYTGPHIVTFRVYGETQGGVKVHLGDSPNPGTFSSGTHEITQIPITPKSIRASCDGNSFDGSVEIISIHPAPHLLLYKNVLAGDWTEVVAVVAITYLADFSDITNSFLVGVV